MCADEMPSRAWDKGCLRTCQEKCRGGLNFYGLGMYDLVMHGLGMHDLVMSGVFLRIDRKNFLHSKICLTL